MTRQEFIDDVTTWPELIEFCDDEECDYCDDIYSDESYDSYVNDELSDMCRNESWQDVKEWLDGLPEGYDYYIKYNDGEWAGAGDENFDSYKDDILEYMDDGEYWDEDEEEEALYEYHDPEDDIPVEEEDISVAELFTACSSTVQKLESDKIADAAAAEQAEAIALEELFVSSEGSN